MARLGTCHCGGTKIEIPRSPVEAVECNCSFCARTGMIRAYFPPDELRFISTEHQSTYSASDGLYLHYFCGNCGVPTWSDSPDWTYMYDADGNEIVGKDGMRDLPRHHSVNLRLIDDLDWSKVNVSKVDGRGENW